MGVKEKNRQILKISGFLEMIAGVIAIIITCSVLAQERMNVTIGSFVVDKNSILSLVLIFMIAALQIISSFFAIFYTESKNNANFCFVLGFILLFVQVLTLNKTDRSMGTFVVDMISIGIPSFYLYAAFKCKNQKD